MHFAACVDVEHGQTERSRRAPLAPTHYYRSSVSCGVIAFLKTLCLQSNGKVPGRAGHMNVQVYGPKIVSKTEACKTIICLADGALYCCSRIAWPTDHILYTIDGSAAGGGPSEGCTAHISFRLLSFPGGGIVGIQEVLDS